MHLRRALTAVTSILTTPHARDRRAASPAVLSLDLDIAEPSIRTVIAKRATQPVDIDVTNGGVLYTAPVKIGTPPQSITLQISMTAADTWINAGNSTYCKQNGCKNGGTYNLNTSSSYLYLYNNFSQSYADGTGVSGNWILESLTIGGDDVKINNQQMGLAMVSSTDPGMLGLAYAGATGFADGNKTYPVLMEQLVDQGRIKSQAYSLYLNTQSSKTGSILFGGVDTEKFTGRLGKVPVIKNSKGKYDQAAVNLTYITYGDSNKFGASDRVILSPETTLTYLPNKYVSGIAKAAGATYDTSNYLYTIDCSQAGNTNVLNFTFTSVTVSVPMSELVIKDGSACIFGLNATTSGSDNTLGLTFMRSAYTVFDLSHNQVSLGQTKFNATKSRIMEIDDSATAAALTALGGSSSTSTNTTASGSSSTNGTANNGGNNNNKDDDGGLSAGAYAGIGVGAFAVVALGILGAFFLWRRRRNQKRAAAQAAAVTPTQYTGGYGPQQPHYSQYGAPPGQQEYYPPDPKHTSGHLSPVSDQDPRHSMYSMYGQPMAEMPASNGGHDPASGQPLMSDHEHGIAPVELPAQSVVHEMPASRS